MTQKCVTDEQYGKLWRRLKELARRVDEGTILFSEAMLGVQHLIEGVAFYDIVIDYNRPLAEMIQAGNYSYVHRGINSENFSLRGKGKHELIVLLFRFQGVVDYGDVYREMEKKNYEPGKIEHLLALGERYPEIGIEFSVVALGAKCPHLEPYHKDMRVAGIFDNNRSLNLDCLDHFSKTWDGQVYRFLAVRKE